MNLKSESDRIRIFFISRVLSFKRAVHLKSCILIVFVSVLIFFLLELLY